MKTARREWIRCAEEDFDVAPRNFRKGSLGIALIGGKLVRFGAHLGPKILGCQEGLAGLGSVPTQASDDFGECPGST